MVAPKHHVSDFSFSNGFVESLRDFNSSFRIGIQNSGLRPHNEFVLLSSFYPTNVIGHLLLDFFWSGFHHFFQHGTRDFVSLLQVFRFARSTYPTKRSEPEVEAHWPHNILNIRRILEVNSVGSHNVCACSRSFQQKGVPVVKEISSSGCMCIYGIYLSNKRFLYFLLELFRIDRKSTRLNSSHVKISYA